MAMVLSNSWGLVRFGCWTMKFLTLLDLDNLHAKPVGNISVRNRGDEAHTSPLARVW